MPDTWTHGFYEECPCTCSRSVTHCPRVPGKDKHCSCLCFQGPQHYSLNTPHGRGAWLFFPLSFLETSVVTFFGGRNLDFVINNSEAVKDLEGRSVQDLKDNVQYHVTGESVVARRFVNRT